MWDAFCTMQPILPTSICSIWPGFVLDALPSAVYDVASLEQYACDVMTSAGVGDFGRYRKNCSSSPPNSTPVTAPFLPGYRDTTIPRAVSASAAIRCFTNRCVSATANMSTAVCAAMPVSTWPGERGAELAVCINSPIDHTRRYEDGDPTPPSANGMQAVANQIMRDYDARRIALSRQESASTPPQRGSLVD